MSEDFVKSVLREHMQATMPSSHDPWPSIKRRVQPGTLGGLHRWGINRRPVGLAALGALVAVLALLGSVLLPGQTRVLSAQEIWAQTEQASQLKSSAAVRTAHMMTRYRYKFEGMSAFGGGTYETWYQSPDRMFEKSTYWGADQVKQTGSMLHKGKVVYSIVPESSLVQVSERDTPVGFGRLSLVQLNEDYSDSGRIENAYNMRLLGTEQIVGRPAYVLERTVRPEVLKDSARKITAHRTWLWVDQELYIVLRELIWDETGSLVEERSVDFIELNKPLASTLFELTVPPGYSVADIRPATTDTIAQGWQEVYRKMNVTLFETSDVIRYGPDLRRPYYEASQGVVSQALVSRPTNIDAVTALIVQGPPSAIDVSRLGSSTVVTVGKQRGRLYGADKNRLVFDLEGTRIMIYSPQIHPEVVGDLVRLAETLVPVAKK